MEADSLGHDYLGTEHVLLAIVAEGRGVAAAALERDERGLRWIREAVLGILEARPG